MSRTKTGVINPPIDLTGTEELLEQYAKDDARISQINSGMDEQFATIRAQHAAELQSLNDRMGMTVKKIHMFVEANRESLFDKKKSLNLSQGTVGFRTGTPACTPAKGFTWAKILEAVERIAPKYLRMKKEVDKELMVANREIVAEIPLISACGVEIVQKETFFIELKKEGVDAASLN